MGSQNAQEFRRKHGRLRRGWKKILEEERRLASPHDLRNKAMREFKLKRVPTLEEAKTVLRLGRKLTEMGEYGVKVTAP